MPGPGPHAYEQDILEEDLDDSPYTPYSYPKKAKAKKGKAMKKWDDSFTKLYLWMSGEYTFGCFRKNLFWLFG